MKKFKDWYKEVSGKEFPNAADYYDNYDDDRVTAEQLRKIAKEIDALLT